MNAISASPLKKRPWAVERNCGLTARQYISTMTDSANAARGGSSHHPNIALSALRSRLGLLDFTFGA